MHSAPLPRRTLAVVWATLTLAGLGLAGVVAAAADDSPGPPAPGVWAGR